MADEPKPALDRSRFIRRLWLAAGVLVLLGLLVGLIRVASQILLTIFAGILLAVLIDGLAGLMYRHTRMSRLPALVITFAGLIGLAVGLGFWMVPVLSEQLEGLVPQLSGGWERIREWLGESAWGRRVIAQANPEALMDSEVVQRVGGWITSALGMLATTIIILAFGVYYAISPSLYIDSALRLAPSARRERLGDVIGHIGAALRSWLAGRFISMVLVAGGTWLGLEFIGVPIALALGFLAGALSFVPNVGPILGSIPGIIVALSVSPMTAVWAAVVYVSVQAVESYAITPFIEFRAVSLPPGFLLAVQLLLGLLAGILGLFLATPLAVVAVVALQMLYLQDVLGEDVTLLDDHSGHDRSEAAH